MYDKNRDITRYEANRNMPDPNRTFARGVLAFFGLIGLVVCTLVAALYWYVVVFNGIVIP